jgi:adenylate cyclase
MEQRPARPDAIDILDRAKGLYAQLTPANTLLARELLEGALRDPEKMGGALAETYALFADILTCDYLNRWNGADTSQIARAEEAARAALEIDPQLPLAHYASGFIFRAKGDHEAALAAYQRTLELNPEFARAYAQAANELVYLGRLDEVPPLVETAIERTTPGSLALGMFYWIIGRAYFFGGRYADAIPWLRQSVEVRPNLWYNRLYLVSAYAFIGDRAQATAALRDFDDLFPGYTVARVRLNEQAIPNRGAVMVEGRERFRRGLVDAGMREA